MTRTRLGISALALFGTAQWLFAAEFSARVLDNLGNPVVGARIVAWCSDSRPDGTHQRMRGLFTLQSGPNGLVSGKYKQPTAGCDRSLRLRVEKEGYAASHYDAFRPFYVLRRNVQAEELRQIVQLSGDDLTSALRNLLTSNVQGAFEELAFYYDDRLRLALRSLAEDPEAGIPARSLLAFVGVPEDLRLIAQLGSPKDQNPAFAYRWLSGVTCSLLEPASESEWDLLRESALGKFADGWVTRCAIQSLKLIASPRSRQILEEVQKSNSFGAKLAPNAIEYIQSEPPPLRDQQLEELGRRVAQALGIRTWTGNGAPRYNEAGDKALIIINFDAGSDIYAYTGAFQRVDGIWVLRGIRETMQGLKASTFAPIIRKAK